MAPMPDNDIVPRVVRPPFRRAAKLVMGNQDAGVVGDELIRACAKELRLADLPPLREWGLALRDAVVYGDDARWRRLNQELRDHSGQSAMARALYDEGSVLREVRSSELASMTDSQATHELAEGALARLARASVFGPEAVVRETLGKVGWGVPELRAYEEQCLDSAQFERLAERLVDRPSGDLRAPRAQSRRSTRDMLDEDLGS